jgi:hypothetical protein
VCSSDLNTNLPLPNSVVCLFDVDESGTVTAFYNGTTGESNVLDFGGDYSSSGFYPDSTIIYAFTTLDSIIPVENRDTRYTIASEPTSNAGVITGFSGEKGFTEVTMTFIAECFNEGTKILCLKNEMEEYVPIENLRQGDAVKTYKHGYRKIDMIGKKYLMNHPDNEFRNSMYKMVKTLENGLTDDLIVTGGHSILVDAISDAEQKRFNALGFPNFSKHKIEDKHLLLAAACDDFVKLTDINTYTYYHFILENDDDTQRYGVWANGVLTETMNKKKFMEKSFNLL